MDSLLIAAILSNGLTADHARGALPDAPVVPDPVAAGTRARAGLAGLLRRAADLVASPRRLAAETGSGRSRWDESPCRPSPTMSA